MKYTLPSRGPRPRPGRATPCSVWAPLRCPLACPTRTAQMDAQRFAEWMRARVPSLPASPLVGALPGPARADRLAGLPQRCIRQARRMHAALPPTPLSLYALARHLSPNITAPEASRHALRLCMTDRAVGAAGAGAFQLGSAATTAHHSRHGAHSAGRGRRGCLCQAWLRSRRTSAPF